MRALSSHGSIMPIEHGSFKRVMEQLHQQELVWFWPNVKDTVSCTTYHVYSPNLIQDFITCNKMYAI